MTATVESMCRNLVLKDSIVVDKLNALAALPRDQSDRFDSCLDELVNAFKELGATCDNFFALIGGDANPTAQPSSLIGRLRTARHAVTSANNELNSVTRFNYSYAEGKQHIENARTLNNDIMQAFSAIKLSVGLP